MFEDLTPKYTKAIDSKLFLNQEFVSQFICPLCEGVLYQPSMELCGCMKLFCKNCLEKYLKFNNNKCPISGDVITKEPKLIDWVQNSLQLLDIKCKNYGVGCAWTGKYSKLNEHLNQCPKEPAKCTFKGCNIVVMRENLEDHLKECQFRVVICNKCGQNLSNSEINIHDKICPNKEVKCPQNCGAIIERSKVSTHLTNCPNSFISCPFEKVGCQEKFSKNTTEKEKELNMNNNSHMNLLLKDYLNFKEKIINHLSLNKEEFDLRLIKSNLIENNEYNISTDILDNESNNKNINVNSDKHYKKELTKNGKLKKSENSENNHEGKIKDTNNKYINKDNNNKNYNKNNSKNESINNDRNLYFQKLEKEENKNELLGLKRAPSEINDYEIEIIKKKINSSPDGCTESDKIHKGREKSNSNSITNPFLNVEEKKNKDVYNVQNLSEGFKVFGNTISSDCLEGKKHSFVFAHDSKRIRKEADGVFIITFFVKKENKWLAMGLCDKKIVEENNYAFAGKTQSNGCFIISTNNMMWHCFDKGQRKKINTPEGITSLQDKNILFECKYTPHNCELSFFVEGKHLCTLTNVRPLKSDYLTPCLVFLKNCSVQTNFDYPY